MARVMMMLLDRLQEMMNHIIRHLFALPQSILASGAEVNAQPDARIHVFLGRLRETGVRTIHTARRCAGRNAEIEIVRAEEVGQHLGGRAGNGFIAARGFALGPFSGC